MSAQFIARFREDEFLMKFMNESSQQYSPVYLRFAIKAMRNIPYDMLPRVEYWMGDRCHIMITPPGLKREHFRRTIWDYIYHKALMKQIFEQIHLKDGRQIPDEIEREIVGFL